MHSHHRDARVPGLDRQSHFPNRSHMAGCRLLLFRGTGPLLAIAQRAVICCCEPQRQRDDEVFTRTVPSRSLPMAFGEIVGIVAFRLPPSLISTAGELGLARKLVARVVVWKARGRAFDVQVGLGDWAWPSAAWLLEVHSEPGSLVSRGTLQVTVRTRYFFVRSRRSWESGILMSSATATPYRINAQAALTTRVAREAPSGQHGGGRSKPPPTPVRSARPLMVPELGGHIVSRSARSLGRFVPRTS